ncbi:MAG: hypothetical protein UY15_C0021G0023 [Parcubacteria group bacterium GW2011_GWA2_47_9]|nr:MAG: hypothetical protein UY15_C0021G0023 [Parcubacteria group bacterium GW2011_GWA2_47_9]
MKIYFSSKILLPVLILLFVGIGIAALALSESDITYPVAELGNCKTEAACKTFCDKPQNIAACVAFAEKYNLLSPEELARAKAFLTAGEGPGGCSTPQGCENYCNDASHIEECIAFADEHNLIPPDELDEAKKVLAALRRGAKLPGGCAKKSECEAYCSEPSHMEECIIFAEAAGFIPPDELADAKKMLVAIKNGAKPPPCRGKAECDAYCQEPENFEGCLTFAEAAGLIPPEELEGARMALVAIKKGVRPPPCRGKEECDAYCSENMEECITFAEAAGMMTSEDAAMARKTGGKGPGDCKGKEECEQFCQDPANQETCFNFAKENGLIPEDELQRTEGGFQGREEGLNRMREALSQAPPQILDCLRQNLGEEVMDRIMAGDASVMSQDMGDKMRSCFESMMPPGGPEGSGGIDFQRVDVPPSSFSGPGGCQTPEECMAYCQAHPEECSNFQAPQFAPPEGFVPSSESLPPQEYLPQEQPLPTSESGANLLSVIKALWEKVIGIF